MREKQLTLGSLFDGSGGFPLAGLLNGIALPVAVFVLGGITELVENETRGTD